MPVAEDYMVHEVIHTAISAFFEGIMEAISRCFVLVRNHQQHLSTALELRLEDVCTKFNLVFGLVG